MHLEPWTIELNVPPFVFDFGSGKEDFGDEAVTRIDGKVRVFGEPITLTRRGKNPTPTPRHGDGPGPSLESVLTNLVEPS